MPAQVLLQVTYCGYIHHRMAFNTVHKQIKTTPEDILAELHKSLQTTTVVGIFLTDPPELITTAVKHISEHTDGSTQIELMPQDLHGYPVERNVIPMELIQRVISFNIPYDDPQYQKERRKEQFKV